MVDQITREMFSERVGDKFQVRLGPSDVVELELVDFTELPPPPPPPKWGAPQFPIRQEPFSLVFRGQHDSPLPQQMYTLEHDTLGTIEGPFLAPIGTDQQGFYYESIFN